MALKTNMTSLKPRRQAYKKDIILMSKGFSNPVAWPGGRLTVYPWDTSIDAQLIEATRRNSNFALYDVLEKVCNLNGGSVDDFVAAEVNVVLLVSRALACDGVLSYQSQCPFCSARRGEKIRVPDELEKIAEKNEGYPGYDTIVLPVCKDEVTIRPLLVRDEKLLATRSTEDQKAILDLELRQMLPVVTVNSTRPDTLDELTIWYRALDPRDLNYLVAQEQELSPHLNSVIPHKCENVTCQREFTHMLTFAEDFFRSAGTKKP